MRLKIFAALFCTLLGLTSYFIWLERGRVWWRVTNATLMINGQSQEHPRIYSQGTDHLLVIVHGHNSSVGAVDNAYVVHDNEIGVPNWGDTYEIGRLFIAPKQELPGVFLGSGKFDNRYPYSVSNNRIEFVDQMSDEYQKIEITFTPPN